MIRISRSQYRYRSRHRNLNKYYDGNSKCLSTAIAVDIGILETKLLVLIIKSQYRYRSRHRNQLRVILLK